MTDSRGLATSGPESALDTACREYMVNVWRITGLAESTITRRVRLFRLVGRSDATTESIGAYLRTLPALSTRYSRLSEIRATYRLLVRGKLLRDDPTIDVPKVKNTRWTPRPLGPDEVGVLLACPDDELKAWFTLALYSGLRASEIAHLEAEQLEKWDHGWALRIVGKGGVEGVIPAHPFTVELLIGRTGRLWPVTPNHISSRAKRFMKRNGIEGGIHRCRHTFATRALHAAENDLLAVRDLLRHSTVATTQVYTQLPAGRLFEVMAKL